MVNGIQEWDCLACGAHCQRPNIKGQRPKWCAECRRRGAGSRTGICIRCGKAAHNQAKFCSRECGADASRKSRELILHPNPQRPPRAIAQPKPAKPRYFVAGWCRVCGMAFVSQWTITTCSPACSAINTSEQRREAKQRRRARKRSAFVAPVYRRAIYERDGWRCQICRRKVKRDALAPAPLAPTIDHIIPLSQGGTHEPANTRLACSGATSVVVTVVDGNN
jgi:5-methylcytosine-specific restriction endonuclease McrA